MKTQRLLLLGATGMVGGHALRDALAREEVGELTSIGRRPTGVLHPKLREIVHSDLGDFGAISEAFVGQDAALFCVGAYTGVVPDDELRRVTVDLVVAFADALHRGSPDAAVSFLSGQGADSREQSRIAYARYKGIAENALLARGFSRVHLFRAGYIYPTEPRREPNFAYRVFRAAYPIARLVYPNLGVDSDDLARVMVHAALHSTARHRTAPHESPILENREIRALVARTRA